MKQESCAWRMPVRCLGVVVMGMAMSSCFYVWQEPIRYGAPGPSGPQTAPAPRTLDELQAQRENQERREASPDQRDLLPPARDPDPEPAPLPKPPRQESISIPTAKKVPGREGFVFSPYNNKLVDVKGFPKGTKVRDPAYAESENKFFRVP